MEKIEEFIEDFRLREIDNDILGTERISEEVIRHLFRSGYCYYFALMLEDAFPGGTRCLAYPFGHIVYVYEDIPYDIEGIYENDDTEAFIPISFLGECVDDFRHIPGLVHNTSKEELKNIYEKYTSQFN